MADPARKGETLNQIEEDTAHRGHDYPRKRAAVACTVCRLRKTRCDGIKPSCSFCNDLGIACQYRGPSQGSWSEEASTSNGFARLEQRLAQFENNVLSMLRDQSRLSAPNSLQQHSPLGSEVQNPGYSPQSTDRESDLGIVATIHQSSSVARVDFTFRQTRIEANTARPSLLTFHCPSFFQFESWNDTEQFYDDELGLGELLFDQIQDLSGQLLDTSTPTCWRLRQSFIRNFLRWIPIFDIQSCIEYVKIAKAQNFEASDLSSCMSMFIFAVGAISDDRGGTEHDQLTSTFPLGLEYFARGSGLLERFALKSTSVQVMQCRILQASYFHFLVRPLQVWNAITHVSRDCMHVFSSDRCNRMDSSEKEGLHRVFWACSMIQHEIEATLKMHPTGLRHYHSAVPLPLSKTEDEELYYFLAQASLRRLLTEAIDAVGFHAGKVIYAPVIVQELRTQIQEWYQHLPPPVRFPLDRSLLFDPRNAFLRSLYIAIHVVITWPSTLRCLEWGAVEGRGSIQENEEWENMKDQAKECLSSCVLYLEVGEELLMGRNLGLHCTIWSTYAILSMLILVHNSPTLAFAPETKDSKIICRGYNTLQLWDHMPIVARGLARTRTMLRQAGIFIETFVG